MQIMTHFHTYKIILARLSTLGFGKKRDVSWRKSQAQFHGKVRSALPTGHRKEAERREPAVGMEDTPPLGPGDADQPQRCPLSLWGNGNVSPGRDKSD